jgi:hypothetical protein
MENENSNYKDDLNTPKIAAVGFISAIIIFALIILMQVMYYWAESQQRVVKDIDQPYLEYATLAADQQAKLAKYQWLDQKEKTVAIPIRRAMELVVEDLSHKSSPSPKEDRGKKNDVGSSVKSPDKKEKSNAQ